MRLRISFLLLLKGVTMQLGSAKTLLHKTVTEEARQV